MPQQTFVEDLFIVDWADDAKTKKVIYHIPEAVWKTMPAKSERENTDQLVAGLLTLIRSEAILGDLDDQDKYFVNLTSLAINKD
jgi:hypothetical protein